MKAITILLLVALFGQVSYTQELPAECYGKYGGEMPAYSTEVDGVKIEVEKQDVYITITPDEIIHVSGKITLHGTYTFFKQSKNEYAFKVSLSNGKSIEYEIDFVWNKKDMKIYMSAKNGQSGMELELLD